MCPDAWLLNYTNPMAMNIQYLSTIAPKLKVARAVPLGVLDGARALRASSASRSRRSTSTSPGSTTRRGSCAGSATAATCIRSWTQRIAADPDLRRRVRVDMYRRLGYYPTETSEHS